MRPGLRQPAKSSQGCRRQATAARLRTRAPPLLVLMGLRLGNFPGCGAPWQNAASTEDTAAAAAARAHSSVRTILREPIWPLQRVILQNGWICVETVCWRQFAKPSIQECRPCVVQQAAARPPDMLALYWAVKGGINKADVSSAGTPHRDRVSTAPPTARADK